MHKLSRPSHATCIAVCSAEADCTTVAVAACFAALPGNTPSNTPNNTPGKTPKELTLQVTPAGTFVPSDGRAMDVPAWRMDGAIAERVIAAFAASRQPLVVDYEHQTLHKEANGQLAPAAGWIKALEWREGRGLYATVELTERARALIDAKEYRYFSPVFEYARATGEVTRILMGALTNNPAIHGMDALGLAAAASARFAALTANANTPQSTQPQQEESMNLLTRLLATLGLPETSTEDAAIAACAAIKGQADAARAALGLTADANAETVTAACTAMATATPDPAKYVPVAVVKELQTSVAALTAQQRTREVDDLVAPALADGRLLPAQEAWARELGKKDIAALSGYLQIAQPIAALTSTQTQGKPPAGQAPEAGLSADELAVAAACGIAPEAFAKAKQ